LCLPRYLFSIFLANFPHSLATFLDSLVPFSPPWPPSIHQAVFLSPPPLRQADSPRFLGRKVESPDCQGAPQLPPALPPCPQNGTGTSRDRPLAASPSLGSFYPMLFCFPLSDFGPSSTLVLLHLLIALLPSRLFTFSVLLLCENYVLQVCDRLSVWCIFCVLPPAYVRRSSFF